jgi:hypothetical protein
MDRNGGHLKSYAGEATSAFKVQVEVFIGMLILFIILIHIMLDTIHCRKYI